MVFYFSDYFFQCNVGRERSLMLMLMTLFSYFSERLGCRLEHFSETVFHVLINLIQNSAKVMATSGLITCRFIIKVNFTHSPLLVSFISGWFSWLSLICADAGKLSSSRLIGQLDDYFIV